MTNYVKQSEYECTLKLRSINKLNYYVLLVWVLFCIDSSPRQLVKQKLSNINQVFKYKYDGGFVNVFKNGQL